MTAEEYEHWRPRSVAEYAAENVVSGKWSAEEASQKSSEEFEQLLPQGLATPKHHLWTITRVADREEVGVLWINEVEKPQPLAFIYNIEIFEPFRRRGHAMQAMTLLEVEARKLGLGSIRLHVFAHNRAAIPLYEKLGYVATNILMAKTLE